MKDGDKVKVEYTGTFEDGTVFDSSKNHDKPLEFTIGKKQVVAGFEEAIKDMAVGEEKDITLKPEKAYGNYNDDYKKKLPKDQFPKELELKPGMTIGLKLPDGRQLPVLISQVSDNEVTIDLNHPLAGKKLKFHLKLLEIN